MPRPPLAAAKNSTPASDLPTDIRAQTVYAVEGGATEFTGKVEMQRGNQSIMADKMFYNAANDQAKATGNVTLKEVTGAKYLTQEAEINLTSRIGHAGPSTFRLENNSGRGDAQYVEFAGPNITRLTRVRYTTCAPNQDDWFLKMRSLKLDTQKGIGTAYNSSVNFYGVPLFYLPYLNFPITDQRKSGFLIPRIGHSTQRGLEIATPYYLNLAPNYDATLTPHYMSERGTQWQSELRYLTRQSDGILEFEILPHDHIQNQNNTTTSSLNQGDNRAAGTYKHRQTFSPLWSGNVDLRGVSDKEYLDDFGDNLAITSQTHLPQNAEIDYRGPIWNFSSRVAAYQTIDRTIAPADRPYARLPQLNLALNLPVTPKRVNYYFDSEAVNFKRGVGVIGERVNLSPALSFPWENSYSFVTPKIGLRHIAYRLANSPEDSAALTRGVFSLDSGLFFERDSRWRQKIYTQTFEPRLYYLYIPYKNQDALPNFDTGLPDLSFPNLFRDNRFTGGDRVSDANQITAAMTTRFIDADDGVELVRASLGRIYYMQDRKVNLPVNVSPVISSSADTTASSDIVGETIVTLPHNWYARANADWNRADDHMQKYSIYLQYNPAKNRIINVGKRFARNELEQSDISTEWPIAGRWTFRARSLYSLRDSRNVESSAGVEYNACCWAFRIMSGRRLFIDTAHDNAATQKRSIMFELELTGLAKLGHVPESPLRQSMFSFPSKLPESTETVTY
ncbi:MAG: LPS-assembly protein LptD [Gammaproteobacteria bacterium]|nr:LPS-assembly protein LptD [Gammaproteobacteria bacterium]